MVILDYIIFILFLIVESNSGKILSNLTYILIIFLLFWDENRC